MLFEKGQFEKNVVKQAVMNENAEKKFQKELGGFWSGSDISMKEKQMVQPKSLIFSEVVLKKENFPPVDLDWGVFRRLSLSTRSRLAQCGIEIRMYYNKISSEDIEKINSGEEVVVPTIIENHGDRAVEFGGEAVRFFWANEGSRLTGKQLRDAISNDIKIGGEEGKDWFVANADYGFENDTLFRANMKNAEFREKSKDVMIVFPMKKKLYIPENDNPLLVASRRDLEDALRPVPEDDKINFYLGETPKVHLGNNICGIINTGAYDDGKRHLISPLIDPGFNGTIRTEIKNGLEYIELFVYKR